MKTNENPLFRRTRAEIKLEHLVHNYLESKRISDKNLKQIPVVKANAYGHGAIAVAKALSSCGVAGFGVASVEEALELREGGIGEDILCLGGIFDASAGIFLEHKIIPTVFHQEHVRVLENELSGQSERLRVYLKIDSGMTRLGFLPQGLREILKSLEVSPHIEVVGALTHLATADTTNDGATSSQYRVFAESLEKIRVLFPACQAIHIANSAAILSGNLGGYHFARPGILLYGSYPHPRFKTKAHLKPVMNFKTSILSLKEVEAGVAISYGGTFVTQKRSNIAVIAAGYADGYSRAFSNCGRVLVRGHECPVVGRVCMDHTMIDVTGVPGIQLGDEVLLWGQGLLAEDLAEIIHTISYELFCGVSQRVPRIYL